MNGEQTMEDKIEYKSKTGHFWVGLRNGRDLCRPLGWSSWESVRNRSRRR